MSATGDIETGKCFLVRKEWVEGGEVGGREERRKGSWKNYRFSGKNEDL